MPDVGPSISTSHGDSQESRGGWSVTSEATWRLYACQCRQVELAELAQRVSGCALHQIFRQSVEPRLIDRLQLLQLRRGIVPALRLTATIGGFAVADLRRALRLSSPVAGLSLCMGHRRAQQGLRSWFHGLRCPSVNNPSRDALQS